MTIEEVIDLIAEAAGTGPEQVRRLMADRLSGIESAPKADVHAAVPTFAVAYHALRLSEAVQRECDAAEDHQALMTHPAASDWAKAYYRLRRYEEGAWYDIEIARAIANLPPSAELLLEHRDGLHGQAALLRGRHGLLAA